MRWLGLALTVTALLAAPAHARPPRRLPEGPQHPQPKLLPDGRRAPEPSPPGPTLPLDVAETPLSIDVRERDPECHQQGWNAVRERLLALENDSDVMSLELWGDLEAYGPADRVLFALRSPRAVYVTLWWLGPEGHLVVPFANVRIPAERNISIDSGGVIVPPYGRELWVAIATLEPIPLGCASEPMMLGGIKQRLDRAHAIGRWEVRSTSRLAPPPH